MAQFAFPFSSGSGSAVGESQWGWMFRDLFSDGVFSGDLNNLNPGTPSGLQVQIDTGAMFIQGFFFRQDSTLIVTLAAADATNPRLDYVAASLDFVANTISIIGLTGTPGVSPSPPTLQRDTSKWQIALAKALVNANSSIINVLTDMRSDPNFGGWASPYVNFKQVTHATQPTKFPVGGVILEMDTLLGFVNTGTFTTPVWSPLGPSLSSVTPLAGTTAGSAGAGTTAARSDHQHPLSPVSAGGTGLSAPASAGVVLTKGASPQGSLNGSSGLTLIFQGVGADPVAGQVSTGGIANNAITSSLLAAGVALANIGANGITDTYLASTTRSALFSNAANLNGAQTNSGSLISTGLALSFTPSGVGPCIAFVTNLMAFSDTNRGPGFFGINLDGTNTDNLGQISGSQTEQYSIMFNMGVLSAVSHGVTLMFRAAGDTGFVHINGTNTSLYVIELK